MVLTEVLHPEEVITRLVFVRHGHTKQTESGQLYSDHHAIMTEKGLAQAHNVAGWLPRETTEVLLSSAATRVLGTAEIVSAALKVEIEIVLRLTEQSVGEWEGRTYLEIKKSDPELYKSWTADPIRNAPPQGESIAQMYERVDEEISAIIERFSGKKITLVTHAGVIRSALVKALGMPLDNFWRLSVPTGSISRIDYSANFATVQYMSVIPDAVL